MPSCQEKKPKQVWALGNFSIGGLAPQGRPCVLPPFLSSEADTHAHAVPPLQTVKGHALSSLYLETLM